MKPIVKTIIVAISSAIIGGAITAAAINYTINHDKSEAVTKIDPWIIKPTNLFAANDRDPFESFFKRHESIQKHFDQMFEESKKLSLPSFLTGDQVTNSGYEILEREDADHFYYDIKVGDLNSTSINTDIKDGQITISGTTERKNSEEQAQSYFKSSFKQSFPLPENVDQNKMQMLTEENKVILKFPKLKT